ncbi:MAG TPA: 3-deoxy-7-phosphoheptulonate synthase [Chloroflexota bacterium]|nr:3-deoxy-7-phosphoheptulonate synthase [Chloroflexota bacterium]
MAIVVDVPTQPIPPRPYRLAQRGARPGVSTVTVGDVSFGDGHTVVMAGPCAVENRDQLLRTARAIRASGARVLRGGAFKPRTSPYDFQGLGREGLELLAEARAETGLLVVTEVMDSSEVDLVATYADILQIGSRNMSAFRLLQHVAATGKPIMLKRGYQATIREWLLSAEYVLAQGNDRVLLCERGIRTFDAEFTRNTLDLNAVPVLRQETHLPIVVDPSHGTGRAELVPTMARAAVAVGADALLIEVHCDPAAALSDGQQTLSTEAFAALMEDLRGLGGYLGKPVA